VEAEVVAVLAGVPVCEAVAEVVPVVAGEPVIEGVRTVAGFAAAL